MPPSDISIKALSSTSLNISWHDVPVGHRHALILGYIIFYRQKQQTSAPYQKLASTGYFEVLAGLKQGTAYIFRLLAYTSGGNGVASNEMLGYTLEEGKVIY